MKRAIKSATVLALVFGTGAFVGIVLQVYLGIGASISNLLRRIGIYHYAYAPVAELKEQLNQPAIAPRHQGNLKLYILVGQSNMAGTAEIPAGLKSSANIFTFGNDYRWAKAMPPIDSGVNQVDAVSIDADAGFGPAFIFAKTLISQNQNQMIGLIPCAKSGSSITDWQESLSDETLYGSCLKRVRAASTMGEPAGILFFQGEADAVDPKLFPSLRPDAEAWAEKFATFAFNFRQDIGQPNLPLVYAQLGTPEDTEGLPNWNAIKAQQESIQIPNAKMIMTEDLPMDGVHYTTESYKVIGQRFAEAMTQLSVQ